MRCPKLNRRKSTWLKIQQMMKQTVTVTIVLNMLLLARSLMLVARCPASTLRPYVAVVEVPAVGAAGVGPSRVDFGAQPDGHQNVGVDKYGEWDKELHE